MPQGKRLGEKTGLCCLWSTLLLTYVGVYMAEKRGVDLGWDSLLREISDNNEELTQ